MMRSWLLAGAAGIALAVGGVTAAAMHQDGHPGATGGPVNQANEPEGTPIIRDLAAQGDPDDGGQIHATNIGGVVVLAASEGDIHIGSSANNGDILVGGLSLDPADPPVVRD
jgi:hypothetical protein